MKIDSSQTRAICLGAVALIFLAALSAILHFRVSKEKFFESVKNGNVEWLKAHRGLLKEEQFLWQIDQDDQRFVLSIAAENGNNDVIEFFISEGLDVNTRDGWGYSALTDAVIAGHAKTSQFLIDSGANIENIDDLSYTPLMWAIKKDRLEIAELLIKNGANIHYVASSGLTPLILASARGNREIVRRLMELGVDPYYTDTKGLTAIDYAMNEEIRSLLTANPK